MIISLISSAFGLGKEYLKGKAEEKKEKLLIKREKVQAKREENQQRETNTASVEAGLVGLDAVTAKQIGWLDDLVVVLTMALLASFFFPYTAEYAKAGVDTLSNTPEWFQYLIASVYVYVLGFKSLIYRLVVRKIG